MDIPKDFTINCSKCGSSHTDVVPLGSAEWLSTCQDCFQQDVITDMELAAARQVGHMAVTGRPLGFPGIAMAPKPKTAKTETFVPKKRELNPVIRDAEKRAGEVEATNPIIENAKKRAEKAHTEVHHV